MLLQTPVNLPSPPKKISHKDTIMLMGSCFTENIGELLLRNRFKVDMNPFGILYNPFSVENALRILINKAQFAQKDLFFFNEQWNSYMHHSRFSNTDKEQCLNNINQRILQGNNNLKSAQFLFITFGTAWTYRLKSTGEIVANCHKVPDREFLRSLMTPQQIIEKYSVLLQEFTLLNPQLCIIFTVSPVRHLKDGAHGNQVSKATLLLAINQLVENHANATYFPSYEIVMDELRDYRFYAEDLVHISSTGVQYIWEKFTACYTQQETQQLMKKVNEIVTAATHKPFNEQSENFKAFCLKNLSKINSLKQNAPEIELTEEENHFRQMMKIM